MFVSYDLDKRPQISDVVHGSEPSLRDLVYRYYSQHFDEATARQLTDEYIRQVMV